MGDNSISNNSAKKVKIIYSKEDINSLKNINDKTKLFLNSAFDKLDGENGNYDGKLKSSEGEIYVFDDGSVSVMKNGKFIAGMSMQNAEAQMVGDILQVRFSDGAESIMKDDKLISGKTSSNIAFTKEGDKIVFEDTKQPKKAPEVKKEAKKEVKTEEKQAKPASSESINGVKKQKIDNLANEYVGITRNHSFSDEDFNRWVKNKADFNKKYQNVFKKLLGEPKTYKMPEIRTDKYKLSFSPMMNPATGKFTWELYDVTEIK